MRGCFNSTFEAVDTFKYLGVGTASDRTILDQINASIKTGNACFNNLQIFYYLKLIFT